MDAIGRPGVDRLRVSSSTSASPIHCVIQAMDGPLTLEATLNPKQQDVQFNDLAQVLHNANLRRSADLGLWLRQHLRRQREIKTLAAAADLRKLFRSSRRIGIEQFR